MKQKFLACAVLGVTLMFSGGAWAARCLFVSSYHQGYEWNDGIEQGIKSVLKGKCDLVQFDMDTKRNTGVDFAQRQGLEAKRLIETLKPDVVIAADDNASRFLVKPYFKDSPIPFVFCGVNWTVAEYGYPYRNVTGMIEVAPIKPLLSAIRDTLKSVKTAVYLSSDVETEYVDSRHYQDILAADGITMQRVLVKKLADWKKAYAAAQSADFIILGNDAGIADWNQDEAARFALEHARKLTVSNYDWMVRYAMLAMTKIPFEQGEWSARVALQILGGTAPESIPITPNRRWDIYVNPALLARANIQLPAYLLRKAVKPGELAARQAAKPQL
jgi:ABC-type uncharacterized transport system substrate-binding protein